MRRGPQKQHAIYRVVCAPHTRMCVYYSSLSALKKWELIQAVLALAGKGWQRGFLSSLHHPCVLQDSSDSH